VTAVGRSSVAEHRFGSSEPYTLGIEEEFMLLDATTLDLVQRADTILDADSEGEFAMRTACEIFQSQIEGRTPICATLGEAAGELLRLREHLAEVVHRQGLVLASSGTHPFACYEDQLLTDRERYRGIVDQLQYPARRELIFGLHVHVGVPDPSTAIKAVRLLRPHVADLIALSASSPFWRGFATGMRSTRYGIFGTFPRSGIPPAFSDYREFVAYVQALERAHGLVDYTHIWWDLRPQPRLGTVEVRAMDAVARVDDAVALAAYAQALVKRSAEAPPPPPQNALEDALVRENTWQATRYGLDAIVVDAEAKCTPIREHILSTLDDLAETSAELESEAALLDIERIVYADTGADRQLATFARSSDLRVVTRQIAAETCAGNCAGVHAAERRG
jgi:carboxylate-amine ligase